MHLKIYGYCYIIKKSDGERVGYKMRTFVIVGTTILSACLMVLGMLYIIDKKAQKDIGGRLIKVHYRFSKEFD